MRQLSGMRGLMAKPDGSIIESPIKANFREGLDVMQYFISTHGARKGLADTALKTANSGYLTRRLVDVAQDVVVTSQDCGTIDGMNLQAIISGGEVVQSLGSRVLGRVVAEDIFARDADDKPLIPQGTLIDEETVSLIEETGIDTIKVRSPITCEAESGICARCYGRDLARGHFVSIGESVGVVAAQSIGEPGTQLTMRTFHIGGVASKQAANNQIQIKADGVVRLHNIKTVKNVNKKLVAISRSGELSIHEASGREKERYKIPYGAIIDVNEGAKVKGGDVLVTWDPHTHPIVTEVAGIVNFIDFQDNVTVQEQVDDLTGLTSFVITDPKTRGSRGKDMRPMIRLENKRGKPVMIPGTEIPAQYFLREQQLIFKTNRKLMLVISWLRFHKNQVEIEILPVVCQGLLTYLKQESQKMRHYKLRQQELSLSAKKPRVKIDWLSPQKMVSK